MLFAVVAAGGEVSSSPRPVDAFCARLPLVGKSSSSPEWKSSGPPASSSSSSSCVFSDPVLEESVWVLSAVDVPADAAAGDCVTPAWFCGVCGPVSCSGRLRVILLSADGPVFPYCPSGVVSYSPPFILITSTVGWAFPVDASVVLLRFLFRFFFL